MGWLSRLLGKQDEVLVEAPKTCLPTVKAPPGYPGTRPPSRPKGEGRTPEQHSADLAAYILAVREHHANIAAFQRNRREALGITHYRWSASGSGNDCDIAKKNNGKVFAHKKPPKEGHVGEGRCNSVDWCRCLGSAIIPGID